MLSGKDIENAEELIAFILCYEDACAESFRRSDEGVPYPYPHILFGDVCTDEVTLRKVRSNMMARVHPDKNMGSNQPQATRATQILNDCFEQTNRERQEKNPKARWGTDPPPAFLAFFENMKTRYPPPPAPPPAPSAAAAANNENAFGAGSGTRAFGANSGTSAFGTNSGKSAFGSSSGSSAFGPDSGAKPNPTSASPFASHSSKSSGGGSAFSNGSAAAAGPTGASPFGSHPHNSSGGSAFGKSAFGTAAAGNSSARPAESSNTHTRGGTAGPSSAPAPQPQAPEPPFNKDEHDAVMAAAHASIAEALGNLERNCAAAEGLQERFGRSCAFDTSGWATEKAAASARFFEQSTQCLLGEFMRAHAERLRAVAVRRDAMLTEWQTTRARLEFDAVATFHLLQQAYRQATDEWRRLVLREQLEKRFCIETAHANSRTAAIASVEHAEYLVLYEAFLRGRSRIASSAHATEYVSLPSEITLSVKGGRLLGATLRDLHTDVVGSSLAANACDVERVRGQRLYNPRLESILSRIRPQ